MQHIWFERGPSPELLQRYQGRFRLIGPQHVAEDLYPDVEAANAIVAGTRLYDASVFSRAPQLLVIARLGIGYDRVDVPAATEHGVAVCNAPDGPTISTAECALLLLLAVARNLKSITHTLRHELRHGSQREFYANYHGWELQGKCLALVGLGRIGAHLARMAAGIGLRVICHDPYISAERATALGVEAKATLAELLAEADIVSLHLPLNEETRHIINAERLAQMKPGAILINTARGGHVDEAALLATLVSGHLSGAGLDVTDPEPPLPDNPLLDRDDVIITPHIASGTVAGKQRILDQTLANIEAVLAGERPPNLLNPAVWKRVVAKRQAILG
ncbi:MAG: NAD(P)-binding domain-containing protein [Anaerolineaceae bacterium]|nr:NAD(P)-binding domain-containing protein [Anaerolineaceae bacterium]